MTDLDDRFSDDSSLISSLTPSQSASLSSGSLTNLSHAGGSAFSVLRRARSVKDQLEAVLSTKQPSPKKSVGYQRSGCPTTHTWRYLSLPLLLVEDPLECWRRHQDSLPRLAKMAFDLLSIPATSCECERLFSQSKLTISTQRPNLKDQTVEFLICLKYWLVKRGSWSRIFT